MTELKIPAVVTVDWWFGEKTLEGEPEFRAEPTESYSVACAFGGELSEGGAWLVHRVSRGAMLDGVLNRLHKAQLCCAILFRENIEIENCSIEGFGAARIIYARARHARADVAKSVCGPRSQFARHGN